MSGQQVFEQAMRLLHYDDQLTTAEGQRSDRLQAQGLAAVNQIYSDLWYLEEDAPFRPLSALSDTLRLSSRLQADVCPYGVAMLLAGAESDGDAQAVMASLYEQKRKSACAPARRRIDVIPRGWGG